VDRAALFVYLPGKRALKKLASRSKLDDGDSFVYSMHTVEKTIRDGTPVTLLDIAGGSGLDSHNMRGKHIRSLLCLPLLEKTKAIGALYLDSVREPIAFRKSDVALLEHLCALISVYLQRELSDALGPVHE
jgi:GAF domain-containing protein